ncbi:LOW QUALITY PROTEIN: hypothetical protein U9M48_030096 [Paspalum notatum var. saurae]|uniref:Uncharacterized protein n=1 Tax=Paspalum notatum var. saurae TaxID=547442 RepID=A0AAQ3TZE1_PASNO
MAEVLATMVVGPLLSMVKDKASSYLLDQYNVMEGMEEQHKLLKRKLPAVLDVIADTEEQAAKHREGAKAWLEEVRKVSYKANDVLDKFKYEALRRKGKTQGHYNELSMDVIKLYPSHNRYVFRYRMANKLRKILQEIDALITEMNTFRFEFKPQPTMSLKWRQTYPYISSHSEDIARQSRADEKKEIVGTLLGQGSNAGLMVLPIVGMGGMGKTTLAQLVYNDSAVQKHFQVRLWVCVSENFDVDSLTKRIVQAAKENGCQVSGNSTLDQIKDALSGKRYLLVLDDVWNRDTNKWKMLKLYIEHGGKGSSVMTTTRDEKVAEVMGAIKAHNIKGLGEEFIKQIIEAGAFNTQAERPARLRKMVGGIAKKCSGSPLAATALGTVLRTKNTVQEWNAVLSRNMICDEENGILPILKLSYNCFPPHMRQCFAFCAMFPKNYEIDVETLIQLWMANCFIPEQQGVSLELTGKQIFNELAQRLFFQEVKQATIFGCKYSSRITCKIHDLMHDVAQDSMGKECASIETEASQSENFMYSARHLFLLASRPETILNAYLEKGSVAIQTLIVDGYRTYDLQDWSNYRFMRALNIRLSKGSLLEPKHLHHIRYLDLSSSDIEALPEEITILYHLQTLNLSFCINLKRLPKAMKYMAALRHLQTHGCQDLMSMPAKLGHLTSLQTLTCFIAGTGLGCSKVGELEKLDLGGELHLKQLENVAGEDARAANIGEKEKLELSWSGSSCDMVAHKEVLEGLEPHERLKALEIRYYSGSKIPTWMHKLQDMVELQLHCCQNLEKLPALWELPALRFLCLDRLANLHCLFSGGTPSKFQKLKQMYLSGMPRLETWWDTDEVHVGEIIFPEVEDLMISECESLTALPKAVVVKESPQYRSAFPASREIKLVYLSMFHGWEATVEGTLAEQKLDIYKCPKLTTFPEAPKLRELQLHGGSDERSLQAASKYITSLSRLALHAAEGNDTAPRTTLQANKQGPIVELVLSCDKDELLLSPLESLKLERYNLFFSDSSALALWTCFGQLVNLEVGDCDALVYWPEKVLRGLVSLRTLLIVGCRNLQRIPEQHVPPQQRGGLLPRLESLTICGCRSLVEVPRYLPASLKELRIASCNGLRSMVFVGGGGGGDENDEAGCVVRPDTSSSGEAVQAAEDTSSSSSTAPLKPLSSSPNHPCFLPRLEWLQIDYCNVANLPPSIKTLNIRCCDSLGSLSARDLPLLQDLWISDCKRLESLPDGPEVAAYSSLRTLEIKNCPGIKLLPSSLHQRLDRLEEKELDREEYYTRDEEKPIEGLEYNLSIKQVLSRLRQRLRSKQPNGASMQSSAVLATMVVGPLMSMVNGKASNYLLD